MPDTADGWRIYLTERHQTSVVGTLDFGRGMLACHHWCKKVRGGTSFSGLVRAWFGFSQPTAAAWCRIGKMYPELIQISDKLPQSWTSIAEIAKVIKDGLPASFVATQITPDSTGEQVERLKAYAASKSGQALDLPIRKRLEAIRVGDDHRTYLRSERAVAAGLNPNDYPTVDMLDEATIEAECRQGAKLDLEHTTVAAPPDGADVGKRAELTALQPHLNRPLFHRLRWVQTHGFNANVVLGVPYGLDVAVYAAVFHSAQCRVLRKMAHDDDRLPMPAYEAVELLRRAMRALVTNGRSEGGHA